MKNINIKQEVETYFMNLEKHCFFNGDNRMIMFFKLKLEEKDYFFQIIYNKDYNQIDKVRCIEFGIGYDDRNRKNGIKHYFFPYIVYGFGSREIYHSIRKNKTENFLKMYKAVDMFISELKKEKNIYYSNFYYGITQQKFLEKVNEIIKSSN